MNIFLDGFQQEIKKKEKPLDPTKEYLDYLIDISKKIGDGRKTTIKEK